MDTILMHSGIDQNISLVHRVDKTNFRTFISFFFSYFQSLFGLLALMGGGINYVVGHTSFNAKMDWPNLE